jgi:hypothetical protein
MVVGGFGPWREVIDKVEVLRPRHIVAGHQNRQLDDDAERTIAETRQYLDDSDELLRTKDSAVDFSTPRSRGTRTIWADGPVGGCQRALGRARTPRRGHRPDCSSRLALNHDVNVEREQTRP